MSPQEIYDYKKRNAKKLSDELVKDIESCLIDRWNGFGEISFSNDDLSNSLIREYVMDKFVKSGWCVKWISDESHDASHLSFSEPKQ